MKKIPFIGISFHFFPQSIFINQYFFLPQYANYGREKGKKFIEEWAPHQPNPDEPEPLVSPQRRSGHGGQHPLLVIETV